jgi:3-deoxy-D-manno-octulosonic-acid transferase
LEIAEHFTPVAGIEKFCGNNPVIVAGSTWEEDEIELLHFVNVHQHIKFIIAPHDVNKTKLKDVKDEFPYSIFYSELEKKSQTTANVLIIDNIGMLSRLYKYATVTYVGGGYGADGVHNVLEAAVYGKPVVFGPVYEKFNEAIGLVNAGGAISIDGGPVKLETILNRLLTDEEERKRRGEAAKQFVYNNAGASKKIMQFIQEKRLLTN